MPFMFTVSGDGRWMKREEQVQQIDGQSESRDPVSSDNEGLTGFFIKKNPSWLNPDRVYLLWIRSDLHP